MSNSDSTEQDLGDLTIKERLEDIWETHPKDYEPYGEQERGPHDCSQGCLFYLKLAGEFSSDWGICVNQNSHRYGKLTFEHQGCRQFFPEDEIGPSDGRWWQEVSKPNYRLELLDRYSWFGVKIFDEIFVPILREALALKRPSIN
ncbi:MAG: hypothetical protein ABEK50_00325 [bacterium]